MFFSNSFQFKFFIYSLYIHIYICYIFFHCTHCRSTHNSSTICFLCVCSGFSLASWCWTGCPKETIAISLFFHFIVLMVSLWHPGG